MSTIGKFKKTKDGFEGHISTLTMDCNVSLIHNENKKNEGSPDYFVKSGQCDLGFARHTIAQGDDGLWAALFEVDGSADLVWSRSRKAQAS